MDRGGRWTGQPGGQELAATVRRYTSDGIRGSFNSPRLRSGYDRSRHSRFSGRQPPRRPPWSTDTLTKLSVRPSIRVCMCICVLQSLPSRKRPTSARGISQPVMGERHRSMTSFRVSDGPFWPINLFVDYNSL